MLRKPLISTSAAILLTFVGSAFAQEPDSKVAKERGDIDEAAQEALDEFFSTVDGGRTLFDKAAGYAVFRVTKAGLGISGAGGQGVAVNKSAGTRVYMNMGAAGSEAAAASATFFEGVAYFQLDNKGLMASADVSGTRFWKNEDLN